MIDISLLVKLASQHNFDQKLNNLLICKIKDPSITEEEIIQFKQQLFDNNYRMFIAVFKSYHYMFKDCAEILGVAWTTMEDSITQFDITRTNSLFGLYWKQKLEGELSKMYNYGHEIIHIPVRKKYEEDLKFSYGDLNDASDIAQVEEEVDDEYVRIISEIPEFAKLLTSKLDLKQYKAYCYFAQGHNYTEVAQYMGMDNKLTTSKSMISSFLKKYKKWYHTKHLKELDAPSCN